MLVNEIINESIGARFSNVVQEMYREILNYCKYIRFHKMFMNYESVGDSLDENDIQNNINELNQILTEYEDITNIRVSEDSTLASSKQLMDFNINLAYRKMMNAKPYPPIDYTSIKEDITDFKAANGQLSAMGSKRPKTKKDSAKNEVEQLFKENKK